MPENPDSNRAINAAKYYTGEDALTEEEVKKLLSVITDLRDEVLIRIALEAGIRREDIVAIELANINLSEKPIEIKFWEEKKNRMWTVYVGGETSKRLEQYINLLNSSRTKTKWLFPASNPERHITGRTAYNILQYWLSVAGLPGRPFHALRATAMKLMLKRGYPPEVVSKITGDTYRVIVERYVVPSKGELKERIRDKPVLEI
jgi:integrase